MRFGRWLYAVQPGAEEKLDVLYQSWARILLGAASWRNWAVSFSELGWVKTGSGRAVVDVAMKRCSLFQLDPCDVYRRAFILGHSIDGETWSKLSLKMLRKWGVQDWSTWEGGAGIRSAYKKYVQGVVEQRCLSLWHASAVTHSLPLPYLSHSCAVRQDLSSAMDNGLPWHSLMLQRSFSRLRANLICFGHLQNRRSAASRQHCIFRDEPSLSLTLHVLCRCERTANLRQTF